MSHERAGKQPQRWKSLEHNDPRPASPAIPCGTLGARLAIPALRNPNLLDNNGVQMNPPQTSRAAGGAFVESVMPLLRAASVMSPPGQEPRLSELSMSESNLDSDSQRKSDSIMQAVAAGAREADGSMDLNKFVMLFGKALRARRVLLGISVTDASRNMQVSKQYLSNVELGKSTIAALLQYSLTLGVRPSSVLRAIGL